MQTSTRSLIGVIQLCSTRNKIENLAFIATQLKQAGERGAQMCFLPECFASISQSGEESKKDSEYLTGSTVSYMKQLAVENNLWLSLGGFQERLNDDPEAKISNTHVIIDSKGEIRSTYRKLHLFDVQIDAKNSLMESSSYLSGKSIPDAVHSPIGNLGLSICYDLRFPEIYRILTGQNNAEILLIPSAFLQKTGLAHWHILLRARAIENQCFVIAAAQAGTHNEKRTSFGHSLVIDPWGTVLLDMGPNKTGIDFVDIDTSDISLIRKRMPCQSHIRNDVYRLEKL